jgi:hypothetical protein
MKLQAWRSIGKNPCDAPPVHISIGALEPEKRLGTVPWVLPLEAARTIFGPVVDTITEEPVEVTLALTIFF